MEEKALTWDELAHLYDRVHGGRPARTVEMEDVWDWAARQTEKFYVSAEGTIHRKEKENL